MPIITWTPGNIGPEYWGLVNVMPDNQWLGVVVDLLYADDRSLDPKRVCHILLNKCAGHRGRNRTLNLV